MSPHDAPRYIHARKVRIVEPDPNQTREHLSEIFSRSDRAAGFKLKYPIQFNRYPEVIKALRDQKDSIRIIHLDRENVLKKFVSKQVLVQQRTETKEFRRSEKVDFEPVHIELDGMLQTLARFESQRRELKKLAEPFEHRFDIEYEQFNSDESGLITQLVEFLDVDSGHELLSKFEKKTPTAIEDSVANFHELVEAIRGTKFEVMLG